jgi:hypothetical protein
VDKGSFFMEKAVLMTIHTVNIGFRTEFGQSHTNQLAIRNNSDTFVIG